MWSWFMEVGGTCVVMGHGGKGVHVWSWVMEVGGYMCGHGSWR